MDETRLIEITDFGAPELDVYARLTENQLVNRADPQNALFIGVFRPFSFCPRLSPYPMFCPPFVPNPGQKIQR